MMTTSFLCSWLIATLLLGLSYATSSQQPLHDLSQECKHPSYEIHVFSTSPLVIYISGFLSADERSHVLKITKDTFTSSFVADEAGISGLRDTRKSKSTTVPRDSLVRCIERRALSFQGFHSRSHLEPLQLVSYEQNQSYHFHTDWFTNPSQAGPEVGYNRLSSFFAYVDVQDGTIGGGTNFPMLDAPKALPKVDEWCQFIDCDEPWESGVTFRPIAGNAVFWMNMIDDGKGKLVGDERVLHAGLPVTSGGKVGMNIWTREEDLEEEYRGAD